MEYSKYDLYAYQVIDYLVIQHHYQIIRVQQYKEDIWLMNPQQEHYPVLRISSKSKESSNHDTEYIRNVHRSILNLIQREGPIIVLNTNPECIPIDNLTMMQIRITPSHISNEKILSTFHDLQKVIHESKDMNEEIAAITREIEEVQLERQEKLISSTTKRNRPKVTYTLMGIITLLTISCSLFGFWIKDSNASLVAFGAFYKMNIVAAHEYWRILTAGFFYQDILVLAIHMMAFYIAGKACEPMYRRYQYVLIILVGVIGGNFFMLMTEKNGIALGMGAGISALLGSYLVNIVTTRTWKHPLVKYGILRFLLAVGILLFLPGLSIFAYFGGFVGGIMMGILYNPSPSLKHIKKHVSASALLLIVALLYFSMTMNTINPIDKTFDASIVAMYRNTALNRYAEYLQKCYNKQYKIEME